MMQKAFILYILSKVYIIVILRILMNTFIEKLWGKNLGRIYSASVDLRAINLSFQKDFANIFYKYDTCSHCISHCCHSKVNRFDFIDCFLNNYSLKDGISPWHKLPHLISGVADVYRQMFKLHQDEPPKENCTYLSPLSGCLLPVGYRPAGCVTYGCYKLLEGYNGDDLRQYSSLLTRYSVFRIKCFFRLLNQISNP
jgi:hypothetical protein